MNNKELIKTSLYDSHKHLGAKIVPFAGYLMPINYQDGIAKEYTYVRNNVGIFDVSHMGSIEIKGKYAIEFLNYITTNNISKILDNCAQYNSICNNKGGTIDDIIVYKENDKTFFLIVNASNIDKDYNWLKNNNTYDVKIKNTSKENSLIAIQGPKSRKILSDLFKINLKNLQFYTFKRIEIHGENVIISRTGYTGELGYEILGNHTAIKNIWNILLAANINPCGLGVRDILRLEMKYCLYGNDLTNNINPIHAGLKWIVDFSKNEFIGKEVLRNEFITPTKRLVCFIMKDKAIPRRGYDVFIDNVLVGYVSSGTFSIGLKKGIGLALIDKIPIKINTIDIEIRNNLLKAEIVKPPFIDKYSLHS